jgi:hypothetical protein
LTDDHKGKNEKEKNRIEAAGGSIQANGRVNGGLAVTRSIGFIFFISYYFCYYYLIIIYNFCFFGFNSVLVKLVILNC